MLARRRIYRRARIHHRENSHVLIVTEWVKECRTKKQAESLDTQQHGSSRVECWVCNRKGHKSRDCKKRDEYRDWISARAGIDRNNVKCFFCDQIGHIVRDCPKKWRKNEKVGCGHEVENNISDS